MLLLDCIVSKAFQLTNLLQPSGSTQQRLQELVFDLTALAWSFEFMTCLGPTLDGAIHDVAVRIGRLLDNRMTSDPRQLQMPALMDHSADLSGQKPSVLVSLRGMIVVLKPSGWEVDGKGSKLVAAPSPEDGRIGLSTFVHCIFPSQIFKLPHCTDMDHGFLHRLDVPSSGLVLAGVTMEGYYSLRLQLNTYRLAREYFVLCHGLMPAEFSRVALSIGSSVDHMQDNPRADKTPKSTFNECGKPAESFVKVSGHSRVARRHWKACWTIVGIRIRTGRHHQIRTHMLFSDHPTAADAKYTVLKLCDVQNEACGIHMTNADFHIV